jgi:hypothetical protein
MNFYGISELLTGIHPAIRLLTPSTVECGARLKHPLGGIGALAF